MGQPALTVPFPHIEVEGHSTPVIAGSTMKVVELIVAKDAYGWSAEELRFQYPHLSMAQIHSALAYYWENKEALDREIEQRSQQVEELRSTPEARQRAAWIRRRASEARPDEGPASG